MYQTRRGNAAGTKASGLAAVLRPLRRWARDGRVEAVVWCVGLVAMATMAPNGDPLFRLCPLNALGAPFCPGCGLGHAVAHLARGNLTASIQAHPLGVPAVLILVTHVVRLLRSGPRAGARPFSF